MNNDRECCIQLTINLPPDDQEAVNCFLRNYNKAANPRFWAKLAEPQYSSQPLQVVVRDGDNSVAGGVLAETVMLWLKIQIMAVREDRRHQGLGKMLLERVETEARRRGCKYAFVDTMDYQSPGFYQQRGYEVVGSIPDWDSHGHTKLYLTKPLLPVAS